LGQCCLLLCACVVLVSAGDARDGRAPGVGWGKVGHQIAAQIAQGLLSAKATAVVRQLIPSGDMGAIASWADDVRNTPAYRWSAPLHFINTPDWLCTYVQSRDCANEQCCDPAIRNMTNRLADTTLPVAQHNEAFKFLVHFVGDIHQPLHVSFTSDLGGNKINVTFDNKKTNLHSLWDSGLIYYRIDNFYNKDENNWQKALIARMNGEWKQNVTAWKSCKNPGPHGACSKDWADESILLACEYAYRDETGAKIQQNASLRTAYFTHVVDVIEAQIVKAGVRMANVINQLYV